MTSIKRKPTVLGARRNTVEQEREQFQKSQEASFRKAVNDEEAPVKMKHVRNLIIGTHTDKNGSVFWGLVTLSPPISTDITAWKFCHTLHLTLRDGHPKALHDSIGHINRIRNMGEHFRHLPMGYGALIQRYSSLLVCKLTFHQHYPRFPGALQVSPEELEAIAENDANNYFEMAVEMLEYMEKILGLYEAVFRSLDPSRANSMTKMGQCRLAPLIPCIQDSSSLYDFIVRILFQLHKVVPLDMLSGHRTRFNSQFNVLQQFYSNTRNLQYFKTLIQVPHLPQVPPNFLIEAELRSHVAPVVVLEEELTEADIPIIDTVLINTSEPEPPPVPPHPHPDVINSHNGSLLEVMAERESLITSLNEELRASRNTIQTIRSEVSYEQEQLKLKINDLESTIAELDSELMAERQSKESILAQVEAAAASAEAVSKLAIEETLRRSAEDKYSKLKEVYLKLREEHIGLIRTKAELEKSLRSEKENLKEQHSLREELENSIMKVEGQVKQQIEVQEKVEKLNEEKESFESKLSKVFQEKEDILLAKEALQMALGEMKLQLTQQQDELQLELSEAKEEMAAHLGNCVSMAVESSIMALAYSLSHFDNEAHSDMKSTPEYTLLYKNPIMESISSLLSSYCTYQSDVTTAQYVVRNIELFGHYAASFLLYAKAASNASPHIDTAENLINALEELSKHATDLLENIRNKTSVGEEESLFRAQLERCCDLVSRCVDILPSVEDVTLIVEREMESMDKAIKEAVEKFSKMLEDSRAKDTGMQLEVNEGILGTCGELMAAVRILVQRASELQNEIVVAGKAGASPREFYKRNHRWTEGLISGAKTVAIACQALVMAADQLVGGTGKFEEVIVASREIAASSMQLVMSSRVKADRSSVKLVNLNSAAKNISTLTGTVVATAESCRDKVTEATTLDFSKLTLHSAKRLEMETLVKVLETEKQLEVQRTKLSELRRHHYQLAGELEGWEKQDML